MGVEVEIISLGDLENKKSNHRIKRLIHRLLIYQPLVFFRILKFHSNTKHKKSAIYLYTENLILSLMTIFASKIIRSSVYLDVCEWWGLADYRREINSVLLVFLVFMRSFLFRKIIYPLVDGLICISSNIERKLTSYSRKILIIPALTDVTRSHSRENECTLTTRKPDQIHIFYSGSFKTNELPIVFIRVIIKILNTTENVKWIVCGPVNPLSILPRNSSDKKNYLTLIGLKKINYKGLVERKEYLDLIADSSLIILPRDRSMRSECSFPTRLPEFLASNVPVLTLHTNELDRYLLAGTDYVSTEFHDEDTLYLEIFDCVKRVQKCLLLPESRAKGAFSNIIHCRRLKSFMSGRFVISKVFQK